jgi:hypothetical protein
MIPFDNMPEDNARLAHISIDFPLLQLNTSESCPVPLSDVVEYLRLELPDGDTINARRLKFLRTAQVAEQRYWIWAFQEADGTHCYITVATTPEGSSCIGYEENYYKLTPEQFMLGDYHNVF